MVFRLEEAVAAAAAPSHAHQRVCIAVFETTRYLMYASDAMLVILAEMADAGGAGVAAAAPRSALPRRIPQFELWQVWNVNEPIRCVRFNHTHKIARGAVALCIEEGRGVLLMPSSAAVSALAARLPPPTADARKFGSRDGDIVDGVQAGGARGSEVSLDYVKAHLHLQLPTWKETVRWKCDDRLMSELQWVERGEDLLLIGAGEKITIWKLVDDAVQVYLQHSFVLGASGPAERIRHFDVAQNGLLVATAGLHDRLLKVWVLDQITPKEGSPMRLYLAHARALAAVKWSKDVHTFKNVPTRDTLAAKCEMLFTLDKNGTISIWRENLTQRRSFALWKSIDTLDLCGNNLDPGEEVGMRLAAFGLIDNYWTRQVDPIAESFGDLVLGESHMLSALCMFHYGYSTFSEARQNALYNQRMDGSAKMNTKLLGQRSGSVADTHGGETFICGDSTLDKTFSVHLMYGVHENGDLSLFRAEFITFSGVTPRISLLATCSQLRHELSGAVVYRVSSSDFKDRENGALGFTALLIFQRTKGSTNLKIARLRLQAVRPSSPTGRNARGTVAYSVQECEVGDVCSSILNAPIAFRPNGQALPSDDADSLMQTRLSNSCAAIFRGDLGLSTDTFDLFRVSPTLRSAHMVHQLDYSDIEPSATHNAYDTDTHLIFVFSNGVLRGYNVDRKSTRQPVTVPVQGSITTTNESSAQEGDTKSEMLLCCSDTLSDDGTVASLQDLITVGVPESVKKEWSASLSMFGHSPAPMHHDYSVVVGLKAGGAQIVIWIFQITPTETPAGRVQLFRKSIVQTPQTSLLSISNVPSLQPFEIVLATVDTELSFKVWTFDDVDDPRGLKLVHSTNVAKLLEGTSQPTQQEENMSFHITQEEFTFKLLTISACGRAAVLVGNEDKTNASTAESCKVCIFSVVDTSLEGVVSIPPKQFGEVISLEWTPFVTPERDCTLLFVTSTSIGMIKCDCLDWNNRWSISWTSSRFDVRLHAVASLSNYPNTWISIGPSFARINLHDLDISSMTVPTLHPAATSVLHDSVPESRQLPAYHPIMLLYLLARGCFRTLEAILEDVKEQVMHHEQSCYLRMIDDTRLKSLAPIALSKLLGNAEDGEERSDVYLNGKLRSGGNDGLRGTTTAQARASDLFADFGTYRRSPYSATSSGGGNDRADMLFASPSVGVSTSVLSPADDVKDTPELSAIERDVFVKFFQDHADSLSFLPSLSDAKVFLDIVGGMKKLLQWERDDARKKDAASLRFYASLLWPFDRLEVANAADNPSGGGKTEGGTGATVVGDASTIRGISSEQVAWAAISDFQNELLEECFPLGKITWKQMQQLRLPFWVRSVSKLATFTEKAAQAEFAATRDPFAVAIFYVLLGKTKLLAGLFKMANQARVCELLSNDFSDVRWRNAAIKNAYVLKAKQRFTLSAAFFLLGGKPQEAIAVAEHDDKSLVLSFLIARLYEKWDFAGQSGSEADTFGVVFSDASLTGLSSSLHSFGVFGADGQGSASDSVCVCVDFLNTAVWVKAERHEDIYLKFLVKYLTGDTSKAVDCLLSLPKGEMRCGFSEDGSATQAPTQYWRMFGKTLLGASEIIRFLRNTISPIKVAVKEKVVKLNVVALSRMQRAGLTLAALFQQRDLSKLSLELSKSAPSSFATAELLGCRLHILTSAVGCQIDFLYTSFVKETRVQLLSSTPALPEMEFEERVDEAIETAVASAGKFRVEDRPETHNDYLEAVLKQATVDSLKYSGRLAALDFLVARWNATAPSLTAGRALSAAAAHPLSSPVPQFIDFIIEGIAIVGSGDVVTSATDQLHTRRVDQVCSELLSAASRLLIWLFCFHMKPVKERSEMESAGYVRLAVSAVYSVVCVCSRYIRCPSCLYRVCAVIFPHKPPLSKKADDRLKTIASADVCAYCSTYRRPHPPSAPGKAPLLQDDIPALFQVVQMLHCELENFAAEVKTNRLELSTVDPFAPFSYCPYWTMLLVASCSAMPTHVSKIASLDSLPPQVTIIKAAGQRLVESWWVYNGKISKFAIKHVLCELTRLHFSPFVAASGAGPGVSTPPSASAGSSPVRRSKSADASMADSDTPKSSSPPLSPSTGGSASPTCKDFGSRRQLLKCPCDECPWLLVLNLFAEKDELLLRLSGQIDVCNEKINNEIAWGRLPEIPSRKAPLTRSQKILLTSVAVSPAAGNRASELSDLIQKRGHVSSSTGVNVQPVYRSETNIKGICFNRAAETVELVYCSSKGICRTSSVDYSDGGKLQFKGMYGAPQSSTFFPDTPPGAAQRRVRVDGSQFIQSRGAEDMLPPPVPTLSVRVNGSPGNLLSSSPLEAKASSFKPTTVESHPFLPLYVSGNHKGQVHLWSFDSLSAMGSFRSKEVISSYPSSPSMSSRRDVKAIRFDNLGQQMGAVDNTGHLLLWKFGSLDRATYYRDIECHDKGAKALTFINSGSCVATAGISSEKRSICVWDTLLPTSKSLIAAPVCHPAGATAVVFSSTHQLLISGGEGGAISVFDMRQRRVLHNLSTAHETAIKTLALHPSGACLLSGSASGDVKIWSLPIFREVAALGKVHSKQSFLGDAASNMAINVTNLSWGVTDSVATEDYFFTSGTDGSIQRVKVPALSKPL